MRDLIFEEIRKSNEYSRKNITDEITRKKNIKELAAIIHKIVPLADVAKREGLLALEGKIIGEEYGDRNDFLEFVFMQIVDGNDWNDVEEITLFRYFADGSVGFDALKKLIILIGAMAIQAGESSYLMEERLRAMISSDIAEEVFEEIEKEKEKESERELAIELAYMEELCVGDIAAEPQSRYYPTLKKLDDAIIFMKDEDIQRLCREVEFKDLAVAMKGLSGNARKKIFSNLSSRLAPMIAGDIKYLGPLEIKYIAEAAEKTYAIIEKLINPPKTAYDRIREKVSREKYVTIMSTDGKPDLPEPINEVMERWIGRINEVGDGSGLPLDAWIVAIYKGEPYRVSARDFDVDRDGFMSLSEEIKADLIAAGCESAEFFQYYD